MARALTPEQAQKALRAFKKKTPVEQAKALDVAVRAVEPVAKRNLAKQPVPNRSSVIERKPATSPGIRLRYKTFPWVAGAEMGAHRYPQFKRYVGLGDDGYIVGSAIKTTEKVAGVAAMRYLEAELKEELT